MKHRQIRKVLAAALCGLLASCELPIVLRDYQREAHKATLNWLEDATGTKRALIPHATGLGKTTLFASLAAACEELDVLIIVPNKVLVQQTATEIAKFTKHPVGHLSSLKKQLVNDDDELVALKGFHGHRIVITTDQSFKRHAEKIATEFRPHVIFWDECHWSYTELSAETLKLFKEAVIIGYSATPDYLTTRHTANSVPVTLDNGQTLYADIDRLGVTHYETILDRRTVRWGIENEWLAPLAWGSLEFAISLDDVPVRDGVYGIDYDAEAIHDLLAKNWSAMEEMIVRLYEDNVYDIRNRRVTAICAGIHEAESLARKIRRYVNAESVTSGTKDDEVKRILTSFDADEMTDDTVRFVSSVYRLREGWDSRNAEICIMLRPTRSRVFYEQAMGRVLRLRRDGKPKVALILDVFFLNTKFAPLSAPVLFGVPGQEVHDGDVLVGPGRRGRRMASPYLPKGIRPRLHIVDALEIEHWAGKDGFFSADGKQWGTKDAWERVLDVSYDTIDSRLKDAHCSARPGKDQAGRSTDFYCEEDVRRACADLLGVKDRAGLDGTFRAKGKRWGTVKAWCRIYKVGYSSLQAKIKAAGCIPRKGRDRIGGSADFYSEDDVRRIYEGKNKRTVELEPDGTFIAAGKRWGTKQHWGEVLDLSPDTVEKHLKSSNCPSRNARPRVGPATNFYAEDDVRRVCAHLLKHKK